MPTTLCDSKLYGPDTQKKEKGRLVNRGMGGFLNPPGHPEHNWSVEFDLRRRPENRGSMSLSAAVECEWLDPVARGEARRMLLEWEFVPGPKATAWIRQVLGYFKGCYKNDKLPEPECWNASHLFISQDLDPMIQGNDHAGVHLIRRYYPEYVPTKEDFDNAKWGS